MSSPRLLYLASQNAKKLKELQQFLANTAWEGHLASELAPDIGWEENGDSFEANALIKARAVKAHTSHAVLADDSGLCVDALGGAPGIFSARYAGEPSSDVRNNEKLMQELAGVPWEKRTARFVCCLAFIDEQGKEQVFRGTCEGRIVSEAKGTKGFGYDPYFVPLGYEQTFAELASEIKNRISHRANAIAQWLRSAP